MRGAGRTRYRGSPAGVSELREVVQHLLQLPSLQQQQPPGARPHLYVVGYSYGSCIAAHAMQAFPQQVRREDCMATMWLIAVPCIWWMLLFEWIIHHGCCVDAGSCWMLQLGQLIRASWGPVTPWC